VSVGALGAHCVPCGADYPLRDGVLHLTAGKQGAPGYDPHYFATLAEVESRHFWFAARRRLVREAIGRAVPDFGQRRLFDIGCGSGGMLAYLASTGIPLAGACDAYPESLQLVRRRTEAPLVLIDEGRLPPLASGYSLLSLFDVLEHIDADEETLRFLHSILLPGGVLVLTVPAHPFLFDEMDRIAHNRRRYRGAELRDKLRGAGFEIRLLTHFMAALVPSLLVVRSVGRLFAHRLDASARRNTELRVVPFVNGAMSALVALERYFVRWRPLSFGTSILAVARRGDG